MLLLTDPDPLQQHAEYCEHEYGRDEPCLQIVNFLFFRDDIQKLESLEERHTAYGHFSEPYGKIEVMNVLEGMDGIFEQLYCEEEAHIYRLLLCLEAYPYIRNIDGLADELRAVQTMELSDRCREKLAELLAFLQQESD